MTKRHSSLLLIGFLFSHVSAASGQNAPPPQMESRPSEIERTRQRLQARLDATGDPYVRHSLGKVLYADGKVLEARTLWDEAAQAEPNLPRAEVALALELMQRGRTDAAQVALNSAREIDDQDPQLYLALAELAFRTQGLEAARQPLMRAQELAPRLPAVLVCFGRYYLKAGDLTSAETFLQKATELASNRPEGWIELANLRFAQNRLSECLEALQQAEPVDLDERPAELRMADLYLGGNDFIGGRFWLQKSVERQPNDAALRLKLAQTSYRLTLKAEAKAELEQALKIEESVTLLFYLAQLVEEADEDTRAVELYRRALELDPEHLAANNNLATTYLKLGLNTDEAVRLAETALESDSKHPALRATYGCTLCDAGRSDEAEPVLAQAVRQQPSDPWVRYFYGKLLLGSERQEEARQHLAGCLILDPEFPRKAELEKLLSEAQTVAR